MHSICLSKFPLCRDVKQIKDRQKVILQGGTKKTRLESASCGCVVAAAHAQQCIDYEADILGVIDSTLLVGHFLVQAPGMKTLVGNGLWHSPLQQLQPVVKLDALSRAKKHNPSRRLHSALQHKAWQRVSHSPHFLFSSAFMLSHWRLVEAQTST